MKTTEPLTEGNYRIVSNKLYKETIDKDGKLVLNLIPFNQPRIDLS